MSKSRYPAARVAVVLTLTGAAPAAIWGLSHATASPPQIQSTVVPPQPAGHASSALNQAIQLSTAFTDVSDRMSPAVVTIKVESEQATPSPFSGWPFGDGGGRPGQPGQPGPQGHGRMNIQKGSGSGVIFRADGAILTNNHVVDHARRIDVTLDDGRTFKGEIAGVDAATDLAVVRIAAKGLPAASFADSSSARVGEWVLALGAPFGLDHTMTAGILSAKGRGGIGRTEIEDYLQTDASINPGNSGGPLVNLHGEVLGINTMIIGQQSAGIGFAIPSNIAKQVAEQLLSRGKVSRAWIGVSFQEMTPELATSLGLKDARGALVAQVVNDGPAAKSGVHAGDVIVEVDDKPIAAGRDLLREVLGKDVGAKTKVTLVREGKRMSLALTTALRPTDTSEHEAGKAAEDAGDAYGLAVQQLTPDIAQQMGYRGAGKVVISGVQPGSPADRVGLQRYDVIVEADKQPLESSKALSKALADGSALLRVERDGGSLFVVLTRD